jgi:hypothetical protein
MKKPFSERPRRSPDRPLFAWHSFAATDKLAPGVAATMRTAQIRFKLRSMMIVIALLAIACTFFSLWWNQPPALDPFDTLEMIGPARSDER